jgi:hypothetical protein
MSLGTAVIDARWEQEDPHHKEAIESVARFPKYFTPDVHILVRALPVNNNKAAEGVVYHDEPMDPNDVQGQALIYLPSNLAITGKKVLDQLEVDMERSNGKRTRFATSSFMHYEGCRSLLALLMLGFYPVMAVVDWWRSLFVLWGYQRAGDLRVQTLVTQWRTQKSNHSHWFGNFAMTRSASPSVTQHVRSGEECAHLMGSIRAHPHYGWIASVLWFPFTSTHYYLFALPWWNWIVRYFVAGYVPGFVTNRDAYRIVAAILYDYPLSRVWWTFGALHMAIVVGPVVYHRMRLGSWEQLLAIVVYPIYLTLAPLLWFVSKITSI